MFRRHAWVRFVDVEVRRHAWVNLHKHCWQIWNLAFGTNCFRSQENILKTMFFCLMAFNVCILTQGSATYGPRAGCGPPRHFTRPATFYCHPARDLFFFNDRYAAINGRNDSHFTCWSSPSILPKKGLNFWQKPFFFWSSPLIRPKKGLNFWWRPFFFGLLDWWRPAGTLIGLNVAH